MISKFLREQKRYSLNSLLSIFECSENELKNIIKTLREYDILKIVKKASAQLELSELQNEDIKFDNIDEAPNNDYYYVFTFVGLLTIAGRILKIYPKYIFKNDKPIKEFKQILKVISKYNSKEQIIKIFNANNEIKNYNLLAILLFLINDFYENGTYQNSKGIIENNGNGEILWDNTINDTFALICRQTPLYTELKTKRTINNNNSYIKNLYECIVTKASAELSRADILSLFDITPIEISTLEIDDFGDNDYILHRLEQELSQEFTTRKQLVLKVMYTYIQHQNCINDLSCFSMFGTNSFNLIWEKICATVMNNLLNTKLSQLKLPIPLKDAYKKQSGIIMKDLIDKPYWSLCDNYAKDTLIPDIVTFCQNKDENFFVILDAKYYCPIFKMGETPKNQPGIESITKQYLYNLAYRQFSIEHGFNNIKNYFIMPTDSSEIENNGYVELKMLKDINLGKIENKSLPAYVVFEKYLANDFFDICTLL